MALVGYVNIAFSFRCWSSARFLAINAERVPRTFRLAARLASFSTCHPIDSITHTKTQRKNDSRVEFPIDLALVSRARIVERLDCFVHPFKPAVIDINPNAFGSRARQFSLRDYRDYQIIALRCCMEMFWFFRCCCHQRQRFSSQRNHFRKIWSEREREKMKILFKNHEDKRLALWIDWNTE